MNHRFFKATLKRLAWKRALGWFRNVGKALVTDWCKYKYKCHSGVTWELRIGAGFLQNRGVAQLLMSYSYNSMENVRGDSSLSEALLSAIIFFLWMEQTSMCSDYPLNHGNAFLTAERIEWAQTLSMLFTKLRQWIKRMLHSVLDQVLFRVMLNNECGSHCVQLNPWLMNVIIITSEDEDTRDSCWVDFIPRHLFIHISSHYCFVFPVLKLSHLKAFLFHHFTLLGHWHWKTRRCDLHMSDLSNVRKST